MAIDGEIETLHQKIQRSFREHCIKYLGGDNKLSALIPTKTSDKTDQETIMEVLQYILDKLHSLDQYVRMKPHLQVAESLVREQDHLQPLKIVNDKQIDIEEQINK